MAYLHWYRGPESEIEREKEREGNLLELDILNILLYNPTVLNWL